ncbi:MAG: AAA family ATPase [Oligoflexia bacterium]|nr:AAA family ATPase [Oligoflexia bacterium]MBF0367200.1 AAA family ATPase [Oligoflexia bacterium]
MIFSKFFNLSVNPFSETPDTKFYFQSDSHNKAQIKLLEALSQGKGILKLTGEVGTGKTTIARMVIRNYQKEANFALCLQPQLEGSELLFYLAEELGIIDNPKYRQASLLARFSNFLMDSAREKKRNIILIDEAQVMSLQAMETIRLLSNLECETQKLLQIVLIGQPELDEKLNSYEYRQINQRISGRIVLLPLDESECGAYIRHRLDVASGGNHIGFSPRSIKLIYKNSAGIPRLVNLYGQAILGYAEKLKKRYVEADLVKMVMRGEYLIKCAHYDSANLSANSGK